MPILTSGEENRFCTKSQLQKCCTGLPWWPRGGDFLFQGRGCGFDLWSGSKIPHASQPKYQNREQKQYCNEFNKDFINGPHRKKPSKKKKKKTLCENGIGGLVDGRGRMQIHSLYSANERLRDTANK